MTATREITPTDAAALVRAVVDEVGKAIVGKRPTIELIMAGLLADGHVLLDDVPGVAKTLTARSIATAGGLSFSRVQFTPDLLPADITGSTVLDLATREARFRPGPRSSPRSSWRTRSTAHRRRPRRHVGSDAGAAGHGGRLADVLTLRFW